MKLSFSQETIIKNFLKIVLVIIIFLIIEYFAVKQSIKELIVGGMWADPKFISTAIIFFSGYVFAWVWYRIRYKVDIFLDDAIWRLKSAYKGYLGEKSTFDELKVILGSEYKIYPNFKIPGTEFDSDFIIIGPKGIISIEVKNIKGDYEFIGEETYRHNLHYNNECLCRLNKYQSPSKEIIRHCTALENWLSQQGFRGIKPVGLVLLVNKNSSVLRIEPTGYYVVPSLNKLSETLENKWFDFKFNSELCQKLNNLFDKFS